MQNMTKRGNVYYIRFIVPKERLSDVGTATGRIVHEEISDRDFDLDILK
jgi:hypothetical protein